MPNDVPGFVTVGEALANALDGLPLASVAIARAYRAPQMSPLTWRLYTHRYAFRAMFSVISVGIPLGLNKSDDSRSAVFRFLAHERPYVDPRDREMVCHHERGLLALLYLRNLAAMAGLRLFGRPAR